MSGAVTGGWGFVWAAYGITALILGIYVLRTILEKAKGERRKAKG